MSTYIDEHNGNKCLTLVYTDKSKDAPKNCGELWKKIKELMRSIFDNSGNYDEKYMNIRFTSEKNTRIA